jgi:DNA polymerase III delta subunit
MGSAAGRSRAPQALPAVRLPGRLAREAPPPVVVLAGAEAWFRERGVEALVRRALPEGDPGGAVVALDARIPEQRARLPAVGDELRSASLFAPRKVVVVRNPEAAGALPGQGRRAALTHLAREALEAPAPGALLVLATARPVKGREAVATRGLLEKGAWVVDCRPLYDAPAPWERGRAAHDHELARFVAGRMRRVHGKRLGLETAHALTQRVGSDLHALDQALGALVLLLGAREAVEAADVEAVTGRTREDPVWRLVDAVLDGEVAAALDRLEALFARGLHDARGALSVRPEALFPQLVAALHAQFRRVLAGAEGLARGATPAEIAREQGVPAFLAERHAARCRRDPEHLLDLHARFVEAEVGVKGGGVPPRVAAERLVAALVQGMARRQDVPVRG